ncbi:hypothetical protein SAMN05421734_1034 [Pelagirhabdus alkalitolerans]|uniref:Uncharacterized protein n=1 Tax=Pelagirhabdus alkalitolerans TaxID=1612202 RepID=A0A1G6HHR3_9BACI|nr:hypothetical protein SAMN05421734_1034 [Pelagirhabdus alkalitolerans]
MSNKQKLIFSIIGIAILSILTPEIVSFFMHSGNGVMLTTNYYINYIVNVVNLQIGLFYLFVLSIILFIYGNK